MQGDQIFEQGQERSKHHKEKGSGSKEGENRVNQKELEEEGRRSQRLYSKVIGDWGIKSCQVAAGYQYQGHGHFGPGIQPKPA